MIRYANLGLKIRGSGGIKFGALFKAVGLDKIIE